MDKSAPKWDNGAVIQNGILMEVYAHSRADAQIDDWQTLQVHSEAVAEFPDSMALNILQNSVDAIMARVCACSYLWKSLGCCFPMDKMLIEYGYLREMAAEEHSGRGRKPSTRYEVNPLSAWQN